MKVEEFVTRYNAIADDEKKEEFIKEHIVKRYVPLAEKQVQADNIINASYYVEGRMHINSVVKYMLTNLAYLAMYTDLKLSDNSLVDFDSLNEVGFFEKIQAYISQKELAEFAYIIDLASNDAIANEYEPHAFIRNQAERFGSLIGATLLPFLEALDLGQIENVVKEYMAEK